MNANHVWKVNEAWVMIWWRVAQSFDVFFLVLPRLNRLQGPLIRASSMEKGTSDLVSVVA
eukprot:scaffold24377_cov132-Cylindrotheca_fusiformis.AAC.3